MQHWSVTPTNHEAWRAIFRPLPEEAESHEFRQRIFKTAGPASSRRRALNRRDFVIFRPLTLHVMGWLAPRGWAPLRVRFTYAKKRGHRAAHPDDRVVPGGYLALFYPPGSFAPNQATLF